MSDSLFLDPLAQPPARDPDASTSGDRDAPGAARRGPLSAEVPLAEEQAVEAFLDYLHLWWPARLRACGEGSHVGLEDGLLVEEGEDGRRHEWGRTGAVDAAGLHLRWHGLRGQVDEGAAADVVLGFASRADGAGVTAEVTGPPSSVEDWTDVMGAFAHFAGGSLRTP